MTEKFSHPSSPKPLYEEEFPAGSFPKINPEGANPEIARFDAGPPAGKIDFTARKEEWNEERRKVQAEAAYQRLAKKLDLDEARLGVADAIDDTPPRIYRAPRIARVQESELKDEGEDTAPTPIIEEAPRYTASSPYDTEDTDQLALFKSDGSELSDNQQNDEISSDEVRIEQKPEVPEAQSKEVPEVQNTKTQPEEKVEELVDVEKIAEKIKGDLSDVLSDRLPKIERKQAEFHEQALAKVKSVRDALVRMQRENLSSIDPSMARQTLGRDLQELLPPHGKLFMMYRGEEEKQKALTKPLEGMRKLSGKSNPDESSRSEFGERGKKLHDAVRRHGKQDTLQSLLRPLSRIMGEIYAGRRTDTGAVARLLNKTYAQLEEMQHKNRAEVNNPNVPSLKKDLQEIIDSL